MDKNTPLDVELADVRKHLIQKAGNGEKLSSEEKYFFGKEARRASQKNSASVH